MKRFSLILLLCVICLGFLIISFKNRLTKDLSQPIYIPTSAPSPIPTLVKNLPPQTNSLFVPYWTLSDNSLDTAGFNKIIYFGISPTEEGIDTTEAGTAQLQTFLQNTPAKETKLLAIRMTNSQLNLNILKNQNNQAKIINQTIEIAKKNGFSGVVLDLEISAIPFDNLVQQINNFVKTFSTQAKSSGLTFDMTMYGDNFYRVRPFDLKTVAQYTDNIMVMAYDFHKANGDPGPNFPLSGQQIYGYDIQKMTDDFLQAIPAKKLVVIFGLFGYDWKVNGNDHSLGTANPLTALQIQQKFLNNCPYKDCKIQKDVQSAETKITYTDNQQTKHIIWFETMQSIKQKQTIIRQKGINAFSLWAYSYF